MRILFAITNGDRGGAQEHVRILVEGFVSRGHEVAVLVRQPSDLGARLEASTAEVVHWASIVRRPAPMSDLRARRELRATVRSFRPDVLHLHSAKAGILGRGAARGADVTTIFTCHHPAFGPGRKFSHRLIARPVEQATLRLTNGVISVGARDLPMLRKLAPRVPMQLVRNAVPSIGPEPKRDPPPDPLVVWVARMAHPKDPVQAIQAWAQVHTHVPAARLVMCGTGPLLDAARRAAERSPAASTIEVLGHVDDLSEVLARGSLYLLATHAEGGTTMATLEAMSAGLVPVLSDAGDAFLFTHADCGLVAPRRCPTALAAAIIELLSDRDRLRRMRGRSIEFSRRGWSTDDMVEATLAFYERVHAADSARLGGGGS